MTRCYNVLFFVFAIFLFSIFYFLFTNTSFAQDDFTFTVAPPLVSLKLAPGEEWSGEIRVINPNSYPLRVRLSTADVRIDKTSGVPSFITKRDGLDVSIYALAHWLTVPEKEIKLGSKESLDIPVTIRVPKYVTPGGHYGALLVEGVPTMQAPGGSNVVQTIASVFLVRISGEVREELEIQQLSPRGFFVDASSTIPLSLVVENSGNTHLFLEGEVVIYDMFERVRGTTQLFNRDDSFTILPGVLKTLLIQAKKEGLSFGPHKAVARISWDSKSGGEEFYTKYFFVMPQKELGGVILLFLSALFLLVGGLCWYVRALSSSVLVSQETDQAFPQKRSDKERIIDLSVSSDREKE